MVSNYISRPEIKIILSGQTISVTLQWELSPISKLRNINAGAGMRRYRRRQYRGAQRQERPLECREASTSRVISSRTERPPAPGPQNPRV